MNADRIASSYRWFEYGAFGATLEHARLDFLSYAAQSRRVLILGEGDGRFLARLVQVNPNARIAVIESSSRMIHLARCRLRPQERSRVEFHQTDAVSSAFPAGFFDLVVTHFFLDVFECGDAATVIAKVSALLAPQARWIITEFQEPSTGFRKMHARIWLRAMYSFFAAATGLRTSQLPPYHEFLARSGFIEIEHRERRLGLICSQVWRRNV